MPLIPLDDVTDSRLDVYRGIKAVRHSRWSGRFVVEGARLVKRLLVSDYTVESVLISERRAAEFSPWLKPECPVFLLPQNLAAELVGYNFHCGAMACAFRKPAPTLDEVVPKILARQTYVVCPDVNDPENIGTLIRLSAGFGVNAMLMGPTCADPFSRRVLRVSMGNALTLPLVMSGDLRGDLIRLKSEFGVQLIATVVEQSDPTDLTSTATSWPCPIESLSAAGRPERIALLFGNEAQGLGPEWLELCDRFITIPMQAADSLNVAVAAGIFLFRFCSNAE